MHAHPQPHPMDQEIECALARRLSKASTEHRPVGAAIAGSCSRLVPDDAIQTTDDPHSSCAWRTPPDFATRIANARERAAVTRSDAGSAR